MDHGLNGHCLKGLCPGDRRPPTRYISRLWASLTIQEDTRNWKSKQTNLPGGLPSYKSHDTGAGFSKKPTVMVGQEGLLGDWGSPQEMRGEGEAGLQKRIHVGAQHHIGNNLTLGTGAPDQSRGSKKVKPNREQSEASYLTTRQGCTRTL